MIPEARYLSRIEAAQFLTERGYKTAPATLAKRAVVGGGPPFISWGRKPLYDAATLLQWAEARCTGPRRSTSDLGRQREPIPENPTTGMTASPKPGGGVHPPNGATTPGQISAPPCAQQIGPILNRSTADLSDDGVGE